MTGDASGARRRALAGVRRVVAVASGKGGVGKTTVAVNLALALRRTGRNVALYDADLQGPNAHRMLGFRTDEARWPLVLGDREKGFGVMPLAPTSGEPYIEPKRRFGLVFMSVGLWFSDRQTIKEHGPTGGALIRQTLLDVKWRGEGTSPEIDILVVDLPPGTGEPQQTLTSRVAFDGVLLVTTPHDFSLQDTNRSAGLFAESGTRVLGAVENMSYLVCEHCGERSHVLGSAQRGVPEEIGPILLRLPLEPALSAPIDSTHPLTQPEPTGALAESLMGLAETVARELGERS